MLDYTQRHRCKVLLGGVVLLLLVGAGRLVHIQTVYPERLGPRVENQRSGRQVIPARRGVIFDRCGRTVALSRRIPDVFVDPKLVDDVASLARKLGVRLNLPAEQLVERIESRSNSRFVVLARAVDEVTAESVRQLNDPAVGLSFRTQRYYPLASSMAHVLGWVGFDGNGLAGVELSFDDHLRGRDGRRHTVRDGRRRALARSATHPPEDPVDGGHVVLTVDAYIQDLAERELADTIEKFDAESGVVVVLDPMSGEVLAMCSWPTFDPNQPLTEGGTAARRNRALTDPVEPGSSFKPFITSAALDGGYLTTTELIDCHMGKYRFGRRLIKDTKPHGMMDIRGIITRSSNIGMGVIAQRMGNKALHDAVRSFGFGHRTGIESPGEGGGVVYPLQRWSSYSTTSIPMGYEILVTPLQLLTAFSALVNDGVLLSPRIVKSLLDPTGASISHDTAPRVVRRVASTETARFVTRDLLVSVVQNGGGRRAQVGPYRVLGKTGTAKLLYPQGGTYEDGAYLSVFMGAAPVSDPRIAAVALIRRPDPSIGYYGGRVAAPLVGRLLAGALSYLEVPPDRPQSTQGL